MIGGEHKKERFSENITGEQNQPKNRGYLAGTQTRTGGYTTGTLLGNWSEERAAVGYYDGRPVVSDSNWTTSYREMTRKEPPLTERVTPAYSQEELFAVENRTKQSFPGHQSQLDRHYSETVAEGLSSTTHRTYKPPQTIQEEEKAHVPPVLGGTVGAQGRGVMARIRSAILASNPGKSFYPGNVTRTLRAALKEACTDKVNFQINAKELQSGFLTLSLEVTPPECIALVRHFDHKGLETGFIDEIVDAIRGGLNDRRAQLVKDVYALVESLSKDHIVRISELVRLVDLQYCPSVVEGACTVKEALEDFETAWEGGGRDRLIQSGLFQAFYGDVSFEFQLDNDFERFMRDTWHLSGGNGNCRNTSCRRLEVLHLDGRVTVEEAKNDLDIKGPDEEVHDLLLKNLAAQGIKDVKQIKVIPFSETQK